MTNLSIETLLNRKQISVRSANICKSVKISNLEELISFYLIEQSFAKIRNCGQQSNDELCSLCRLYINNSIVETEILQTEKNTRDIKNELSVSKIDILETYFNNQIVKLSIRSKNALSNTFKEKDKFETLNTLLQGNYDFRSIKNIGEKSMQELSILRNEINNFIDFLKSVSDENLVEEYYKAHLKLNFKSLPLNIEFNNKDIFYNNGKFKLFSLIKELINHNQIFTKEHYKEAFKYVFTNNELDSKNSHEIASKLGITNERFRQVKITIQKEICNYFKFLENFKLEDIESFGLDFNNSVIIIDDETCHFINELEETCFNKDFITLIFGYLLGATHEVIGSHYGLPINDDKRFKHAFNANCLIKKSVLIHFDLKGFINHIKKIYASERTDIKKYDLRILSLTYLDNKNVDLIDTLLPVLKGVLEKKFNLTIENEEEIIFESNKYKPKHEYFISILEEFGEPMKLSSLVATANHLYPFLNTNANKTRALIIRESKIFIYFGRSSTYGLKKWEQEMPNLKGGTIRDIVEEYLNVNKGPRHIDEIHQFVSKYRNTNPYSVLTNLKVDTSKRFIFYKNEYVGLLKDHDDSKNQQLLERFSWYNKLYDYVKYSTLNGKMPSSNSKNKNEKAMYYFLYRSKKYYKNGILPKNKEILLRTFGVDLDN